MRPARLLLALAAATALLSCQVGRNAFGSDAPIAGVWGLLPAESAIWFIGIKNDAVAVPGAFGGIEGRFDVAKREASVEVSVGSLRTGDPGRDENLRVHFFDAIGSGKPIRTTIEDGVKALELAEAATTSWREKRIVAL